MEHILKELEIKHFIPYLNNKVYVWDLYSDKKRLLYGLDNGPTDNIKIFGNIIHKRNINEVKMILRPLSDLTKEIEVNGENIIPLEEIFKILIPWATYDHSHNAMMYYQYYFYNKLGRQIWWIEYVKEDMFFHTVNHKSEKTIQYNQYNAFNKLFEWHFDLYNLIPENLAIDINTL